MYSWAPARSRPRPNVAFARLGSSRNLGAWERHQPHAFQGHAFGRTQLNAFGCRLNALRLLAYRC